MRHANTTLLAAAVAAVAVSGAQAADADGNFAIRGIGAQNCGALAEAIEAADETARAEIVAAHATWLGGYLTQANRLVEGRFDTVPFVSDVDMLAIVVDRCEAAPDATVETAAAEILAILLPFGTAELAPLADLEDSVALRRPTVVALQQALIDRGYLDDTADGVVGPRTRAAVEQFNADQGIGGGSAISIETILRAFADT